MDRKQYSGIIFVIVLFLTIFAISPCVIADQLYNSTYKHETGVRLDKDFWNTRWLSIDNRLDSLEDDDAGSYLMFKTVRVSGQSDVVADSTTDTFTIEAGNNITVTTSASGDSVTISATTTTFTVEEGDAEVTTPTVMDFNADDFNITESPSNEANIALADDITVSGFLTITEYTDIAEMTAPSNPSANVGRLYVADAAGTTTLYFKDSAGTVTNLLSGVTDEGVQDLAGAMFTGNTETLITITYQDADGTIDAVVDSDLHNYSWSNVVDADITNTLTASIFVGSGSSTNAVDLATAEVSGVLPRANVADEFIRNNADDTTTGSITLDDGVGDSPSGIWTDGDNYTLTIGKMDAGSADFTNNEGEFRFKASGDTDDYLRIYTSGNEPYIESIGTADLNIRSTSGTVDFGDDNITTTGTISGTWSPIFAADIQLDDGSGDSPMVRMIDEGDYELKLYKSDSGQGVILNNEGAIFLQPNNDTADYLSITTITDTPTISSIGDNNLVLTTDNANKYISLQGSGDSTNYLKQGVASSKVFLNSQGVYPFRISSGGATLEIITNGDTDDYWEFTTVADEPILRSAGATSMNFGGASVTDFTVTTDSTGDAEVVLPNDSIGDAELNWAALNSTSLADTSDLLYETELDAFSEIQAQIADKTLINEEDAVTFDDTVTVTGQLLACITAVCDTLNIPYKSALALASSGELGIDTELTDYGVAQALLAYRVAAVNYVVAVSATELSTIADNDAVMFDGTGDAFEVRPIVEADISDLDHTDAAAIHDNTAAEISAITLKGAPVANDELIIEDSADSYNKKSIMIGTLPVTESQISDLDHPISIGAAFPGAPSEGDQFYFTTAKILFEYDGSAWKPLVSYNSDLQLYVNGSSGTDAAGKGFASGADACDTIQYCVDSCLPAMIYGNVTINISGTTYSEDVYIGGKVVVGNYTITLIGATTVQVAETTVASGVQGTGATQGSVTVAGTPWAPDSANSNFIVFEDDTTTAALRGDKRIIDDNTDNDAVICGTFDAAPAAGDTFTIITNSSTVTSINILAGQKSIRLEHLIGNFNWATNTQGSMYYCYFSHATGQTATISAYSDLTIWDCVGANTYFAISGATVKLYRDRLTTTHSARVVYGTDSANIYFRYGCIVDGVDKTGCDGIEIIHNSVVQGYSTAANGYNIIRNAVIGLEVTRGSGVTTSTYTTFTNNTTDKSVEAATFAWDGT